MTNPNPFALINELFADYNTFRAVIAMSITGSVIAALLFLLKPLAKSRLPKSAQYYLWLVVIAALIVPFSQFVKLPAAVSTPTIHDTVASIFVTNEEIFERTAPYEVNNGVPDEYMDEVDALTPPVWWQEAQDWLHIGWMLGMFAFLIITLTPYTLFTGKLKLRNAPARSEEIVALAELSGNNRIPQLYRNPIAATPMLIGLFTPAIILPDREYTDAQLHTILRHELTHLRRCDVLVKWLSVLSGAVHWFNPLVWLVRREIDRACELSCDEAVIRGLNASDKQSYGDTMIYVAADIKTPRTVLSTTMCEEKKDLKERLGAIMKSKKHTRSTIVISAALIIATISTAVALGASGQAGDSANYDFSRFAFNGFQLGADINAIDLAELQEIESRNISSGYKHNYNKVRFDTDDEGRITRFFSVIVDYNDTAEMWVARANGEKDIGYSSPVTPKIEEIEKTLGSKGKIGWQDREQNLRYEEYRDKNDIIIRFVYTNNEHRLVWATADGRSLNVPTMPTTAPEYDPYFVFQTVFEVTPTPDEYMFTMSSVPGIHLHIKGHISGIATVQYSCESGDFGLLEDNIITTLGTYAERDFGSTPIVHWTPDNTTENGDRISMVLVGESGDLATVNLTVRIDDYRYSLDQDPSTAAETTQPTPLPAQNPGVYFGVNDSPINSEYLSISAQLMNLGTEDIHCGELFTIEKQIAGGWEVVTFADNIGFNEPLYTIEPKSSRDYSLYPEMLKDKLSDGAYRFATEVWTDYQTHEGKPATYTPYTVYAEFVIDENAESPEIITIPSDWFGTLGDKVMTLKEAQDFVASKAKLTISDLVEYKGSNVSSNMNAYNMLYTVEGGYSLHVLAGSDKKATNVDLQKNTGGE
ncbi:MAG: M56 family metallopeptidase [Clostridiales bacterium]|jgi:beta-lactamase regulating signal transducer with metallopeptidase domain|nr:M56 family metallopeptidase [Clostridiales bacterium]